MRDVGGRIGQLTLGQRASAPVGVLLALVELDLQAPLEQHAQALAGPDPDEPRRQLDVQDPLGPRAEVHAEQRQVR